MKRKLTYWALAVVGASVLTAVLTFGFGNKPKSQEPTTQTGSGSTRNDVGTTNSTDGAAETNEGTSGNPNNKGSDKSAETVSESAKEVYPHLVTLGIDPYTSPPVLAPELGAEDSDPLPLASEFDDKFALPKDWPTVMERAVIALEVYGTPDSSLRGKTQELFSVEIQQDWENVLSADYVPGHTTVTKLWLSTPFHDGRSIAGFQGLCEYQTETEKRTFTCTATMKNHGGNWILVGVEFLIDAT